MLVLSSLVAIAALAVWGIWGRGAPRGPETESGTVAVEPDPTKTAALAETPSQEPAAKAVPDAARDRGERVPVPAHTVVRGAFRSPPGVWPGGGDAELHPAAEGPEGGMMGILSMGMQAAKKSGEERRAFEETMKSWLGHTEPIARAEIDPSGAFRIEDPPAGRFNLRLRHAVLRNRDPVEVEVSAGEERDLGEIGTVLAASLLVLVSDPDGRPIPSVSIELGRKIEIKPMDTPGSACTKRTARCAQRTGRPGP